MAIVRKLHCKQLSGIFPVEIKSRSDPNKSYIVHVNPFGGRHERHTCECGSYRYRGYCHHQVEAHKLICGWNEIDGPEVPTDEQREKKICPRCLGPSILAIYEIEDE
jgi:hypothetical protein